MTEKTSPVRHAVSRSTGATTWTRKDGTEWKTTCLNHDSETTAPNRGVAWKNGSTPAQFCAKCKVIAAGKAAKITEGRLDIPAPTTQKAASKPTPPKGKVAARKSTPAKAKPTARKPAAKKTGA